MAKKKKIVKVIGGTVLVFLALLFILPLFFKDKIALLIKDSVNQSINADFDFGDVELSLLKSFPNAYVDIKNVSLINKAPFAGDTLFSAGDIELDMSLTDLFKAANEPFHIKRLALHNTKLRIKVDSLENANYDIALEDQEAGEDTGEVASDNTNFSLNLREYALTDTEITYDDFATGMHLELTQMNHSGSGDLSLKNATLKTKTDALVSFEMDSTRYLNNNKVALDAHIGIDLETSTYSFLENKALINQLPLVFDGFVKLNDANQEVDISFGTPSSDFKNFLALVPEAYGSSIEGVSTTGNFEVDGQFKGVVDDDHIPAFNITITSENASFKYPNLPKSVKNIDIDTKINNTTGIAADTHVEIDRLSFQIDTDKFNLNAKIRNLLGNTKVNLHADGRMDLANIAEAYPVPSADGLEGLLTADITTAFDMASLENHAYANTSTSGQASLSGFTYGSEELKHPLEITKASLSFNPATVSLNEFEGKLGKTDFKASGTLDNLLGYVFNAENIEGRFALRSNTLSIDDFMVVEQLETEESEETEAAATAYGERIKIPSFLDCSIDAQAQTVLYDGLALKDVSGRLRIKDETAIIEDLKSSIFDGTLSLNGTVSTKEALSTFDMALGVDGFAISESFAAMDMFKVMAPIGKALEGKLNSEIKLSGNLKEDMTPNLATLSGDMLAELLATEVSTKNSSLLTSLDNQFEFINLRELNLDDLKAALDFEGGRVNVKPFTVNYKDVAITVAGNHTFDMQLQYQATLDVPAKYLGSEVNNLIAQLDDDALKAMTVPVTANIGGTYDDPQVKTDLKSGVQSFTGQLVELQKQKLLDQGKDKAKELLGGLLNNGDDAAQDNTSSGVVDALGGLLGGKKEEAKTDSTQPKQKTVTNILGGLLGKKKDTVE